MKKEKKSGKIRVASLEVQIKYKSDEDKRWRDLLDVCRGVVNCVWQTWLVWHIQHGTAAKVREWRENDRKWAASDKKTRGPRVKSPEPISKACSKAIYDAVSAAFPQISTDARELLRNSVQGKICNTPAAKGAYKAWIAILCFEQSLPSTVRGNPIPFSKKNAEIEPPAEKDGQWKLNVRFTRVPVAGKKNGTTILDSVKLWSKGRKAAGQVAILRKIAAGEYEFMGSSMVYSESKRKWFAQICYRSPLAAPAVVDAKRVAYLRPSPLKAVIPHPWRLRLPESNKWPGGLGQHVAAVRRKSIAERISRQRGYRFAGSANKGHGRERALQPIWRLQQRWKDFVKTCNYQVAKDVLDQCIEARCGTLVYFQPGGDVRESRFLSCAGKGSDRESSLWDFYQIGARLELLCKEAGVEFKWRKHQERKGGAAFAA